MSNVREESWQIKRRSDLCAGTNEPFADKEEIMTRLLFKDGEYVREDYRLGWWNEAFCRSSKSHPNVECEIITFWKASSAVSRIFRKLRVSSAVASKATVIPVISNCFGRRLPL